MKLFDPSTTKWRPCKVLAKLDGNHLLMANIFKLHKYQTFSLMKMHNMCKIGFANLFFENFSNLFFEKGATKKQKFFIFLKGRYFVTGGSVDMNLGLFWETPVDFLKSVVLQLFPKYSQSNVNSNVKSRAKFNCL